MKKLLSGIVAIAVLLGLATNVKAATIVANKTEANKGDTVTVTVNMAATHSIGTWLKYDADKFEFVSASSSIGELTTGVNGGVVKVAGTSTDKTTTAVSFTFKAKDLTDNASFEVTRLTTESNETISASKISVKVTEKTETPSTPSKEETKTENKGGETTTTKQNGKKVNDEGKVITKLPQTGISYVAIAGLAITAMGSIVAVRKMSK